ncbi:MAG: YceH family protein [Candidatus Acidiferrales bacterium]
MDIQLTEIEARVLGALVEKEITTPEYYPLSLNALVNACNQKSNREPAMNLDDETVVQAMRSLDDFELAGAANTTDSRVRKYEHRLQEVFNFTRPETAVLCVLLLRGAQTPGELRGRAERMYRFEELNDVQATLQKLMNHEPPLAKVLPRQPGTKESRYMHLLCGDVGRPSVPDARVFDASSEGSALSRGSYNGRARAVGNDGDRFKRLESEVAKLQDEIAEIKQQFAQFKKQFE